MPVRKASLTAAAVLLLTACGVPDVPAETIRSERHAFRIETLAEGLDHPWSVAFLPGGGMLITEREGRLRLFRDGKLHPKPIAGVPAVFAEGQGGLHDIVLHPDYARNRLVYLAYAAREGGGAHTRVTRFRLDLDRHALVDPKRIFDGRPKVGSSHHFGGRMAFDRGGYLFLTVGERGERESAQRLDTHAGTMIRLRDDGSVPPDNPFVGRDDALPEIYSYGHRNPQGIALHPQTGEVWIHEHGPRGGDEINIVRPGRNYGWPKIGYGTHYSGAKIGVGTKAPEMEQPLHYWVPSIAPSGMAFYTADAFPDWRGSLFAGALVGELLVRLELDGERVVREERLLEGTLGRIRDVRAGPDGFLYITTDASDGRLLRLVPAR